MTNGWGRTAADMLDGGTPNELLGRTSWTTGFATLDTTLGGGLHAGELTLLGGAQGLGKTTLALQMARSIARSGGRAAYVCYEHTEEELLARLLLMESGLLAPFDEPLPRHALRGGDLSPDDERRLSEAGASVRKYGERLRLVRGWGRSGQGGLDAVADALDGAALFVDYLQKVPTDRPAADEDERVTVVVERLKDIALTRDVPVVAIVASDKSGLATGRMRLRDLRGSTALAYEADVALLLNDKMSVVARHHLVYGSPDAARFPEYVVCTVEKNRSGRAGVDLELRKRFSHGHFEPADRLVAERLVDDRVYVD
jgi:replicative DNA helicase